MEFEWDPIKDKANLEKHGIDFDTAIRIWNDLTVENVVELVSYDEVRIIAFGMIEGTVLAVVYTWRQTRRRIISARKAHKDERRTYREMLARGSPAH
ncbi:MAG: BrnT family toxin [Candidatus Hydrogenedens sp.]|nr:BrnT family toxin [Candidatus Hydrogenedens sp.]